MTDKSSTAVQEQGQTAAADERPMGWSADSERLLAGLEDWAPHTVEQVQSAAAGLGMTVNAYTRMMRNQLVMSWANAGVGLEAAAAREASAKAQARLHGWDELTRLVQIAELGEREAARQRKLEHNRQVRWECSDHKKHLLLERADTCFWYGKQEHQSSREISARIAERVYQAKEYKAMTAAQRGYIAGWIDAAWRALASGPGLEMRYQLGGVWVLKAQVPDGHWNEVTDSGIFWIGTEKRYQ